LPGEATIIDTELTLFPLHDVIIMDLRALPPSHSPRRWIGVTLMICARWLRPQMVAIRN
jgi:hypothetical protein